MSRPTVSHSRRFTHLDLPASQDSGDSKRRPMLRAYFLHTRLDLQLIQDRYKCKQWLPLKPLLRHSHLDIPGSNNSICRWVASQSSCDSKQRFKVKPSLSNSPLDMLASKGSMRRWVAHHSIRHMPLPSYHKILVLGSIPVLESPSVTRRQDCLRARMRTATLSMAVIYRLLGDLIKYWAWPLG